MEGIARELGPTIDELVVIARAAGAQNANRRTIRHEVRKGDVSRPGRVGREWRYPNVAIGQVETIARLRRRGVDPALIRFALFIETATVPPEEAASLVQNFLKPWDEALERESARFQADPEALRDEAAVAARMRGRSPFPHRVRVPLDDRTMAMIYAFGRMFSAPLTDEEQGRGAQQLERIVGLRSGRGGADRILGDVRLAPGEWPTDTGTLADDLSKATPERIEFARRGVEFAVVWIPALRSTLAAIFGAAPAPMIDIIEQWEEKITPDVWMLMFAVFASRAFSRATDAEIRESLKVFYPETLALTLLEGQPEHERELTAKRLRPYQRLRFERLHEAQANGS